MIDSIDFEPILLLVNAPSKDAVVQVCTQANTCSHFVTIPLAIIQKTADTLSISKDESKQLLESLGQVIKKALFLSTQDPMTLLGVFPGEFNKKLKELVTKIILDNYSTWRSESVSNQVSMPKLVDFDWRVDLKTSSDTIARMSVPTCIMQLQVQESANKVGSNPDTQNVNVELSKETLDTMLDGLGKIRDQLSSVANK